MYKYFKLLFTFSFVFISCVVQANDDSLAKYLDDSYINESPKEGSNQRNERFASQISEITYDNIYSAIDLYYKQKFMKSHEFLICIMLLSFAFLVMVAQIYLFSKGLINPTQIIRVMILTLIIFSLLFLIASGYSNDQIAPAVGLLGTIAGYLLGRSSTKTSIN